MGTRILVNTEGMSNEEWLKWRKKNLGSQYLQTDSIVRSSKKMSQNCMLNIQKHLYHADFR